MGGVDAEVVHQTDRVGGHVAQQVGRAGAAADHHVDAAAAPRPTRSWSSGRCRGCRSGRRGSRARPAARRSPRPRRSSASPGPSPGPAARHRRRPSPGSRARSRWRAPFARRRRSASADPTQPGCPANPAAEDPRVPTGTPTPRSSRTSGMRTAIISDLHLGAASGEDVLRDPAVRRVLLEEIADADRVVLLGDVVELRDLALGVALDSARPFFEELGAALGDREVTIVPGNHDHRLAEPLLDRLSARRRPAARPRAARAGRPPPAPAPRSTPGSARPACASPTRGSGCATTSTPPTATTWTPTSPCPGPSAWRSPTLIRLSGPLPSPATPADYERVLRPIYGFSFGVAQARARGRSPPRRTPLKPPGRCSPATTATPARAGACAPPRSAPPSRSGSGRSTACCAPTSSADISAAAIFSAGVAAATELATRLRRRRRPRDHRPHPPRRAPRGRSHLAAGAAAATSTTPAAGSSPPPSTTPAPRPAPTGRAPSPGSRTRRRRDASSCCSTARTRR